MLNLGVTTYVIPLITAGEPFRCLCGRCADPWPPRNTPIEWLRPRWPGAVLVSGVYRGGFTFVPDGSSSFAEYMPTAWRPARSQQQQTGAASAPVSTERP